MYKIINIVNYFIMWNNFDIRSLFKIVEKFKNENKSLNLAFEDFAIKNNRDSLSVRNYYYKMLKYYMNNPLKAEENGIDISKHEKNEIIKFSSEETNNLIEKIESLKRRGLSTRNACMILANNNPTLMLRYQNKYRYFKNFQQTEQKNNNVIKINEYRKNKKLSDDDIKSLFLGLVKLIKTNAIENISENLRQENAENKAKLVSALNEISKKQNEIDELTKQNNELFIKVKKLDDKMNELKNKFLKLKIK